MNSNDEATVRAAVRQFKSRLFNPMIRPFYKFTILGLMVLIFVCFMYWLRVINNYQLLLTILLCIPLGFSFGFFLKPLTSYHFESNFTYYFGVATSFLLASGLSEMRMTAYLILNELFNGCGFLFRYYLSSAAFAPFIGLLLSLAESLYYSYSNIKVRRFTFFLHLLNFLFLTFPSFFPEIYGFNTLALMIYLSIPYVLIITLFDYTMRSSLGLPLSPPILSLLISALTSVLLLLHNCSPLIALVNFQARQILPCLFGKAHFTPESVRTTLSHRGLQACAVYALQQALWVTWFVWGLTPDLDIDPRSGVAGIHNWNEHPVIAGFLLGLQKLGVFPLFSLHIGALIIPNLFPLFLYFALTLVNCLSIHMCFKKFQFKTQVESLMVITLCTFLQFIMVILVKFAAKPEFDDRLPWGVHFVNRVGSIAHRITSACRPARGWTMGYTRL